MSCTSAMPKMISGVAAFACATFMPLPLMSVPCAESPELTVAVVSDVHMRPDDPRHFYENRFRKALKFFDRMKVDAVVGCGDWIELGWYEWFRKLGEYWFEAFPENRGGDGRHVEKLFIFGDHEIENFWNPGITRVFSREYILERDIPTYGRAKIYEETLKEQWRPIMRKSVKGYDFVMAHFTMREDDSGRICEEGRNARWGECIPNFDEFFATNRFAADKPFFCIMHKPPKGTVISPLVSTSYDDSPTKVLAKYPNCITLCGHKHRSAMSERNLWQGAFTCIEVPAMQNCTTDAGHENGWASCDGYVQQTPVQQMQPITRDMRENGGECLIMKIGKSKIVVERWNVVYEEKIAGDWTIPLPNRGEASFEARRDKSLPVAFPENAKISAYMRQGRDRAGVTNMQYVVSFPQAASDVAHERGYDYRVTAELVKHWWRRTCCEKWVYSDRRYLPEYRDTNTVTCVFAATEIPSPFQEVVFTATPYNSFGVPGQPITTGTISMKAMERTKEQCTSGK